MWFDETLLGEHVTAEELRFTIEMVASTANEWDQKIASMFGGKVRSPEGEGAAHAVARPSPARAATSSLRRCGPTSQARQPSNATVSGSGGGGRGRPRSAAASPAHRAPAGTARRRASPARRLRTSAGLRTSTPIQSLLPRISTRSSAFSRRGAADDLAGQAHGELVVSDGVRHLLGVDPVGGVVLVLAPDVDAELDAVDGADRLPGLAQRGVQTLTASSSSNDSLDAGPAAAPGRRWRRCRC